MTEIVLGRLFLAALLSSFIALHGCQESIKTIDHVDDLYRWINNPKNGLVKTKSISGIKLSVKYLPAELLACREFKDENNVIASQKDSVLALYKNNLTFLLTIASDERKAPETNVMYRGIRNYEELTERAVRMNFSMQDYITLKINEKEYKPILSTMENVYELSKERSIYLVFAPDKDDKNFEKVEKLDFVFSDEMFNTGINHFIFQKKNIDAIPRLSFFIQKGQAENEK